MSTAFTKEPDGAEVFEDLPDRPVTPGPNLVTARGLRLIEAEVEAARAALAEGRAGAERAAIARAARDLRYWTRRRGAASVPPPAPDDGVVRFGARVTIRRAEGGEVAYRIVGEDEADPAGGLLSHASPLARALAGRGEGDDVGVGALRGTIAAVRP